MKILILVKGGIVQNVSCSQDAQIVIVDYDKIQQGENPVSEILEPDSIYPDFWETFTDINDPEEMQIREELHRINF